MKRKMLLLAFCGLMSTAMADWTYGTAYFKGSQPSSCMSVGGVMIWYSGSLSQTGNEGGVQVWEGTGDICVVFPKKCASCQKVAPSKSRHCDKKCEKAAHNERSLLNYSYICNVAKKCGRHSRKRLAFICTEKSGKLQRKADVE